MLLTFQFFPIAEATRCLSREQDSVTTKFNTQRSLPLAKTTIKLWTWMPVPLEAVNTTTSTTIWYAKGQGLSVPFQILFLSFCKLNTSLDP